MSFVQFKISLLGEQGSEGRRSRRSEEWEGSATQWLMGESLANSRMHGVGAGGIVCGIGAPASLPAASELHLFVAGAAMQTHLEMRRGLARSK